LAIASRVSTSRCFIARSDRYDGPQRWLAAPDNRGY
jgi:hypothetical protein